MNSEKSRDFIQNILITGLFVLAVILFVQTQLYNLGLDAASLAPSPVPADNGAAVQTPVLSAPVRVAVTGVYGRYGSLTLSTSSETFDNPLGRSLAEALGSAQSFSLCGDAAFFAALDAPSIYYDFLEPLPLSVLSGLLNGAETVSEELSARCLVISGQPGGTALLYLWNGSGAYYRCPTALSSSSVEQVVGQYELGGAYFALDLSAESLRPNSLFLEEPPSLPVLSAGDPLSDTDWLLTALGFNPRSRTRYLDASGTETIMDGDRSLRILANKTVYYQSGSEPTLTIEAEDEIPTLREAALGAGGILNGLTGSVGGSASLYLQSIRQTGAVTSLRFGYQSGGIPIRISGGSAAEITLTGTSVTALTLRLHSYGLTEEVSMLLPLRQALAVAAAQPGAELSIAYVDRGGDCRANWIAD
ncbi:MAG: hypothetical protein HFF87_05135 [Oscillibacter sp.]|jgi:hypothetical protein|nr:hypothetical protein [Oscillibacter sp.]